jgi:hypothetical protein
MVRANNGQAVSTGVRYANCRHPFGGSLSYDVIVDGVYPDRNSLVLLSQPGETYQQEGCEPIQFPGPFAYLAIPEASLECARRVVSAATSYQLGGKFKGDQPITVRLSWENAPNDTWQITI